MGVGDPLPLPPDKNLWEKKPLDMASPSSSSSPSVVVMNARLSDSPVLLFVYFHKAFRAQLAELQRLVGNEVRDGSHLAVELRRKFDFLKLVYMYHSAAEDEVRKLESLHMFKLFIDDETLNKEISIFFLNT